MRSTPLIQLANAAAGALVREFGKLLHTSADPLGPRSARAPINLGTGPGSRSVYGLIFNGIASGLPDGVDLPLAARERLAESVYETLAAGGVTFRLDDGLAKLRRAVQEIRDQEGK